MRTTVNIDEDLLLRAKRHALEHQMTLREVIEEALRAVLLRPETQDVQPFRLVTFRGDGPRPGINLDRTSEVLEMDDLERLGTAS